MGTEQHENLTIDTARCREAAARHHLDHRTLAKALQLGAESVRGGMARDRVRLAIADYRAATSHITAEPHRAA